MASQKRLATWVLGCAGMALLAGAVLSAPVRATAALAAVTLVPGYLCLRAYGPRLECATESFAFAFAASLACAAPLLAIAMATRLSAPLCGGLLAAACIVLAWQGGALPLHAPCVSFRARLPTPAVLVASSTLLFTVGAALFTATGSVDRWWYLGFVRRWAELGFAPQEPFLASGAVYARFASNVWLATLAIAAGAARCDPLFLFDRAAPVLLAPIAVCAQMALARTVFGSPRVTRLAGFVAILLWSGGGPIAGLVRLPEDKILATVVLAPLLWTAVLRTARSANARGWLVATALSAIALAATHPLIFVLAATPVLVWALLSLAMRRETRRFLAIGFVLAVAFAGAVATGMQARRNLAAQAALSVASTHPAARVHRARDRLVALGARWFVVHPRLLLHPIVVLALAGLACLWRDRARERAFLLLTGAGPLAVAFVPHLAVLAGALISPWMVHRVLWLVPYPVLAAIAIDALGGASYRRRLAAVAIVVLLCSPLIATQLAARVRPQRDALRFPAGDTELTDLVARLRSLPDGAVVAAPPLLAERIPALTGRSVLAMTDRSTSILTGDLEAAAARLRARAAVYLGLWKETPGVPTPSHLVAEPASVSLRYCDGRLVDGERYVLCVFRPQPPPPGVRMPRTSAAADVGGRIELTADKRSPGWTCTPPARSVHSSFLWRSTSAWTAWFPSVACVAQAKAGRELRPRTLIVLPRAGVTPEELTIEATGWRNDSLRWRVRTRERISSNDALRFGLPRGAVDRVEVRMAPSWRPFLRLDELVLTHGPDAKLRESGG